MTFTSGGQRCKRHTGVKPQTRFAHESDNCFEMGKAIKIQESELSTQSTRTPL